MSPAEVSHILLPISVVMNVWFAFMLNRANYLYGKKRSEDSLYVARMQAESGKVLTAAVKARLGAQAEQARYIELQDALGLDHRSGRWAR